MSQSHHIYRMLLKGELCRAPIKNPARVLDIGTGTGIWAIDFAEYVILIHHVRHIMLTDTVSTPTPRSSVRRTFQSYAP